MLEFVLPGVSNQLHLLGRPGPSGESPANEGPPTSKEYIKIFVFVKQFQINSHGFLYGCLWISRHSVENKGGSISPPLVGESPAAQARATAPESKFAMRGPSPCYA